MECASWDPDEIAQTGRKTGIVSDARYRLERSVDPALTEPGLELATRLVIEICGGAPMEPAISGEDVFPNTVIDFPVSEVRRLTGLELPRGAHHRDPDAPRLRRRRALERRSSVKVPSWRPDVTQKADLVEEVMRMDGVDKVPVDPLPRLSGVAPRMLTTMQNRRRATKRVLAARGLDEAVTWSFISADEAKRFGGGAPELKLANADRRPTSATCGRRCCRACSARCGATTIAASATLAIFEVGQVFLSDQPEGQHTYATAVRAGGPAKNWQGGARAQRVRRQGRSRRGARRARPRHRQAADRRRGAGLGASGTRRPRAARADQHHRAGSANCIRRWAPRARPQRPGRRRSSSISTPSPSRARKPTRAQAGAEALAI